MYDHFNHGLEQVLGDRGSRDEKGWNGPEHLLQGPRRGVRYEKIFQENGESSRCDLLSKAKPWLAVLLSKHWMNPAYIGSAVPNVNIWLLNRIAENSTKLNPCRSVEHKLLKFKLTIKWEWKWDLSNCDMVNTVVGTRTAGLSILQTALSDLYNQGLHWVAGESGKQWAKRLAIAKASLLLR